MKFQGFRYFILLVIFIGFNEFDLIAQNYAKYRKYNYEWDKANPDIPEVDSLFKFEDAVVLNEEIKWEIYDRSFKTIIKKKLLIKFLTEEGIEKFSKFTLPESVDPSWDNFQDPLVHNLRVQKLRNLKPEIIYFEARLFDTNNVLKESSIVDEIDTTFYLVNNVRDRLFDFNFEVENIEIGDVLEVHYSTYYPIFDRENLGVSNSFRFFFHSDIAKQTSKWHFIFPSNQFYVFSFNNNGNPHEEEKDEVDYKIHLKWTWKNLQACTDETNAKFYKELPYAIYYRHNKEYGSYSDVDLEELKPYSWQYLLRPEYRFKSEIGPVFVQSLFSRKEIAMDEFYKWSADQVENKTPFNLISQWHNYVVENFEYQNDSAYYQGLNNRLENLAGFIKSHKLREISRREFYRRMLDRSVGTFYQAQLVDNRIGELNFYFPDAVLGEQNYYYFEENGEAYFLQAKKSAGGYWLNELPFYLLNAQTLLLKQNIESRFDDDNIVFYNSKEINQISARNVLVKCDFSFENNEALADAKIDLVGQFSTLSRDLYLHNKCTDCSINDRYCFKLFGEMADSLIDVKSVQNNKQAPFDSKFQIQYDLDGFFKVKNNQLTFQPKEIFKHIISEGFDASKRNLTYFSDFQFTDNFEFYIAFDEDVKLLQQETSKSDIVNEFGDFKWDITQINSRKISIRSNFKQLQKLVKAKDAIQIEDIFSEIEKFEGTTISISRD